MVISFVDWKLNCYLSSKTFFSFVEWFWCCELNKLAFVLLMVTTKKGGGWVLPSLVESPTCAKIQFRCSCSLHKRDEYITSKCSTLKITHNMEFAYARARNESAANPESPMRYIDLPLQAWHKIRQTEHTLNSVCLQVTLSS